MSADLLTDVEPCLIAIGDLVGYLNPVDARRRRSVADSVLKSLDRFQFTFGMDFEASVAEIAHPPVQSFAGGCGAGEETEPDALNAAGDDELTSATHGKERPIISPHSKEFGRAATPDDKNALGIPPGSLYLRD